MGSRNRSIDAILNRAAIVSLILAAASLVWLAQVRRPPAEYNAGESFPALPTLDFSSNSTTLVLWLDPRCHVCTESMPFYREILSGPRTAKIVAVGRDPVGTLREYLDGFQVHPDQIVSVRDQAFKFRGTPTLVVVDRGGVVRQRWTGAISEPLQRIAILSAIRKAGVAE